MFVENNSFLNESGDRNSTHVLDCGFHLDYYNFIRACIYLIGIIGNAIVVVVIIQNKSMRTPTFLCIGSLAIADFVFMFNSFMYLICIVGYINIENYHKTKKCVPDFLYYYNEEILWIISHVAYLSSSFHVVVLSIIRYITLVYPLKARYLLTRRKVSIMIACVWFLPLPFSICHDIIQGEILNTMYWMFSYTIPVVFIAVFHLCKLFIIKKTSLSITRKDVMKMNILVITVILVFTLLPLPWNVLKLLFFFYQPDAVSYQHWQICGILLVTNNCVNPILYAFVSSPFQNRLKAIEKPITMAFKKCFCLKTKKSRSITLTCNCSNAGFKSSVYTVTTNVP